MLIGCRFILGIGSRKRNCLISHLKTTRKGSLGEGLIHLIPVLAFGMFTRNQSMRVPMIGFAWIICLFVGGSRLGRLRL